MRGNGWRRVAPSPLRRWDGVRRAERLAQGGLMAAPRSSGCLRWRYASGFPGNALSLAAANQWSLFPGTTCLNESGVS